MVKEKEQEGEVGRIERLYIIRARYECWSFTERMHTKSSYIHFCFGDHLSSRRSLVGSSWDTQNKRLKSLK